MLDPARLHRAYQTARRDLLAERDASGHWIGELSSSALSTATATSALALVRQHATGPPCAPEVLERLIERGVECLARSQNADGGWGDTDKSLSNVATTMLARAAIVLAGSAARCAGLLARAEEYLRARGGIPALKARYGKDKTFAAPILANCALAGLVPWQEVAPLPFELASLPNRLLGLLRLPVVSYAIPALVAIGQARYFHARPRNPMVRVIRRWAIPSSLRTLERMQPASGGFLEATPLTSFVVMALAGTGRADHPVARRGVEFLVGSARPDGSWPIDTNLATWTTTLAINALAAGPSSAPDAAGGEPVEDLSACLDWLLSCQHQHVHPLSSAAPGGWGWTDLSGAVPDADDTAGALLALPALRRSADPDRQQRIDAAVQAGVRWLLRLQNADGGWPTFCRGWGALPFDRSGVDVTAHVLRALDRWRDPLAPHKEPWPTKAGDPEGWAIGRGLRYLARQQAADGRWVPLWFGNQHEPNEENPVYGTARTLLAYRDLKLMDSDPARRGVAWLVRRCGREDGWGPIPPAEVDRAGWVSSTEETALAVEALLGAEPDPAVEAALEQAVGSLVHAVETGRHREASPIGLYFARLWYYERLYPLCFTVSALGRAIGRKQSPGQPIGVPPELSFRTVPETSG
jgi:squalene-hopene/tetraprenyl-beta-curcumene cyclase